MTITSEPSQYRLGGVLANHEMTMALASVAARRRLGDKPWHRLKPVPKAEPTTRHLPMIIEARATGKS